MNQIEYDGDDDDGSDNRKEYICNILCNINKINAVGFIMRRFPIDNGKQNRIEYLKREAGERR